MAWSRDDPAGAPPAEVAFRSDDGLRRLWLREDPADEPGWVLEDLAPGAGGALEPRCEEWVSVSDALALAPDVAGEVLLMSRSCLVRLRRAGRAEDAQAFARDLGRAEAAGAGPAASPAAGPGAAA